MNIAGEHGFRFVSRIIDFGDLIYILEPNGWLGICFQLTNLYVHLTSRSAHWGFLEFYKLSGIKLVPLADGMDARCIRTYIANRVGGALASVYPKPGRIGPFSPSNTSNPHGPRPLNRKSRYGRIFARHIKPPWP